MLEVKLGGAIVRRIEESYEPNFDAKIFFPDWQPAIVQQHRDWLLPNHYDEPSGFLKLGVADATIGIAALILLRMLLPGEGPA